MIWQLGGPWPVGQYCIPAGTILTGVPGAEGEPVVKWSSVELPMPMPLNSAAMDEEAALLMLRWYPDQWYLLHFGPGVELDAIKARARQRAGRI